MQVLGWLALGTVILLVITTCIISEHPRPADAPSLQRMKSRKSAGLVQQQCASRIGCMKADVPLQGSRCRLFSYRSRPILSST